MTVPSQIGVNEPVVEHVLSQGCTSSCSYTLEPVTTRASDARNQWTSAHPAPSTNGTVPSMCRPLFRHTLGSPSLAGQLSYQPPAKPLSAWDEAHRPSQGLPLTVQRRDRSQSKEPEVPRLDEFSSAAPRPPRSGAGPLPQPLSVRSRQDPAAEQLTNSSMGERLRAMQPAPSDTALWPHDGGTSCRGHDAVPSIRTPHLSAASDCKGSAAAGSATSYSSSAATLDEAKRSGSLRDPPPQPRPHSASPCRAGLSLVRASAPVLSSASSSSRLLLPSSRESIATLPEAVTQKAAVNDDEELTRRLYERFGLASCGVSLDTFAHMHRARMAAMPNKVAGGTAASAQGSTGLFGGA